MNIKLIKYKILIVLILYGNTEMGARVWSKSGNLICVSHFFRSINLFSKGPVHRFATCSELPSNISTMRILHYKQGPSNVLRDLFSSININEGGYVETLHKPFICSKEQQ